MSNLSQETLKHNFDKYDQDGSGTITIQEIKEIYKNLNIQISQSALDYVLKKYDTSGDGRLDYLEFVGLLTGKPATQSQPSGGNAGYPSQSNQGGYVKPTPVPQPQPTNPQGPVPTNKPMQGSWGM